MSIRVYILSIAIIFSVSHAGAQENDIYRIEKVPVSSRIFNDMSPVLTKDGIVFCSDRRISAINDVRTFDRTLLYNIYYAARKDTMEWGRAKIFSNDLSPLANEGPFCFTPDGKEIYYTSNVKQGKEAKKEGVENNRGIFIAEKQGDRWTNIRPFKYNDPLWNVGHPFISHDGKYLFFASDIPGGQGGSDLWYCEWVNGEWTDPLNLGPEINSPGADLFPWFSPSGELFFASDRAGGVGGLDLYASTLRTGQWKKASLLPEPINSVADDFSYITEPGTPDGFFTSNRGRTDDIYRFTSLIIRKNNCDQQVEDQYCYEFYEENAQKFDSMPFEYEWGFDDGSRGTGVTIEHCFEEPGVYIVKLNVIDKVTGEVKYNDKSYLLEIVKTRQAYIDSPDTCIVGQRTIFDAGNTYLPGWDINKYYWNFDDGTIATGEKADKVFTSPGTYAVQLIVTAEPDQDGNISEACVSKYVVVRESNR